MMFRHTTLKFECNVKKGYCKDMLSLLSCQLHSILAKMLYCRHSTSYTGDDNDFSNSDVKIEDSYAPSSPYRVPGPRRYGYEPKFFTGGLLPRSEKLGPMQSLPAYKPKNAWTKERALFGQNDYIDILGDGRIHPAELINGPEWLIGFRGNELQRLLRKLQFHGEELKLLYPTKYNNIKKRLFFLHKKYNVKRSKYLKMG